MLEPPFMEPPLLDPPLLPPPLLEPPVEAPPLVEPPFVEPPFAGPPLALAPPLPGFDPPDPTSSPSFAAEHALKRISPSGSSKEVRIVMTMDSVRGSRENRGPKRGCAR